MRILQIGDIHCRISNLMKLIDVIKDYAFDLVAVHGDVECNGNILNTIKRLEKPVIYVPGNLDDTAISKLYRQEGYNIDAKIVEIAGYAFAGIGGLSFYSSLKSVEEKLSNRGEKNLIVLSHFPPLSTKTDIAWSGIHIGVPELRDFVEKYSPIVFMHGHVHESPGTDVIESTLIVNAGALKNGFFALIDTEKRSAEIMNIASLKS